MRLEIPSVPPSLNKTLRMHWAVRKKLNDQWIMWVRLRQPYYYLKPIVQMKCRITIYHSRFYDKDNAYGACKPVVDALKHHSLIADDTREYLDLTVEQAKSSRKEARTVIELEAV